MCCWFCLHDSVRLVCDWAGLGGRGGDEVHDSKVNEKIKTEETKFGMNKTALRN